MATLIEQLLNKLGLRGESKMLEKTTELIRLLELRSANVPLQVGEYGKIVLCADLAAALLSIDFDKELALKVAALRKSQYANNKRMFEKLLDLNKLIGVNDICIQLSLSEVRQKAEELLELYKKVMMSEDLDGDSTHPQYAAMAVFMACKLLQRKVAKTKLMPYSNLRPTQWQQLEHRWENLIAKHYRNSNNNKSEAAESMAAAQSTNAAPSKAVEQSPKAAKCARTEIENYENWKERMLALARARLKEEQNVLSPEKENENIILGA